jgi:hypothetical protein
MKVLSPDKYDLLSLTKVLGNLLSGRIAIGPIEDSVDIEARVIVKIKAMSNEKLDSTLKSLNYLNMNNTTRETYLNHVSTLSWISYIEKEKKEREIN